MGGAPIHAPAMPGQKKRRLLLSFSGGRTSGYMTRHCLERLAEQYEMVVVFANTGQENEATLQFVRDCDQHFGFRTVWVEAVVNPRKGKGNGHRVVTFETANRDGAVFEDVIRKHGIPNKSYPHCTRELKLAAIKSYLRSIGWKKYVTAIGIRPDEFRRVNLEQYELANNGEKVKIIYPLIDLFPADKQDVNDWWEEQPFNLQLREHEGNCKWCWKKSDTKHFLLIRETPAIYNFPIRMEFTYPRVGPEFAKDPSARNRVFFRQSRSGVAMFQAAAATMHQPTKVLEKLIQQDQDANGGCGESCEMYPMEDFSGKPPAANEGRKKEAA